MTIETNEHQTATLSEGLEQVVPATGSEPKTDQELSNSMAELTELLHQHTLEQRAQKAGVGWNTDEILSLARAKLRNNEFTIAGIETLLENKDNVVDALLIPKLIRALTGNSNGIFSSTIRRPVQMHH